MDYVVQLCSLFLVAMVAWASPAVVVPDVEPKQEADTETTNNDSETVVLSEPRVTGPEVQTLSGKVRGFTELVDGEEVHTFLGIPFATPPVGELRFKRPHPAESWAETLNAKEYSASCPQILYNAFPGNAGEDMWNPKTRLDEDCLYLNIWTPSIEKRLNDKLTTMFWIYGGCFYSGSSSLDVYSGKYLSAKEGVIVVSVNYRLGPLGFLYLGEEDAPGNMGLLDQNMAMKWVYDNIEMFGGDQQKITLFGESSGSASVHFHVLSGESTGYFSSVIMQSGSALAPWAYDDQEKANTTARMLAKLVNCEQDEASKIIACLREKTSDELIEAQFSLPLQWTYTTFTFAPTIDDYFLTDSPTNLLHANDYAKVPMLMGVNKNEESYFLVYGLSGVHDADTLTATQFVELVPNVIDLSVGNVTRTAIIHQYETEFSYRPSSYVHILDHIGGDFAFKCPVLDVAVDAAHQGSGSNPVIYVYSFEHRTSSNPWPQWTGVLHGDEIEYVFGAPLGQCANSTAGERRLAGRMMAYWANFARTGNPNPLNTDLGVPVSEWPEYRSGEERYIVLDCGQFVRIGDHLRRHECRFWKQLYPEISQLAEKCEVGGK